MSNVGYLPWPILMLFRPNQLHEWSIRGRFCDLDDNINLMQLFKYMKLMLRYLTCGAWAGKLFCLVMIIDFLLWHLLRLLQTLREKLKYLEV
ncbi:unnamed protein product [Thlaspi arvense]|uniref:Uncharacterized protein n=1 Tax=Thlaspi arvense TaxID=13288 RepID=A0AAU9RFB3_THLAR|nr:unnamed protein product [Thlaspi arvense]